MWQPALSEAPKGSLRRNTRAVGSLPYQATPTRMFLSVGSREHIDAQAVRFDASHRLETTTMVLSAYGSFAYSAFACFRMGMSGSASFQRVKKSWYAALALLLSPAIA